LSLLFPDLTILCKKGILKYVLKLFAEWNVYVVDDRMVLYNAG
jgi:hypothetical protein